MSFNLKIRTEFCGPKFHQKVKGLYHCFWRRFDQFPTFEISLTYGSSVEIIYFGTDSSCFPTKFEEIFELENFTKK